MTHFRVLCAPEQQAVAYLGTVQSRPRREDSGFIRTVPGWLSTAVEAQGWLMDGGNSPMCACYLSQ